MKLLFDQNISFRVIKLLSNRFLHSTSVSDAGLMNASDKEIWDFAGVNGFAIVTQDSDFNDLSSLYGFPPKIIWFRTGNLMTQTIACLLDKYADDISNFLADDLHGCFEFLRIDPNDTETLNH